MLNKTHKIQSLPKSRFNSLNKYDQAVFNLRRPISRMHCHQCGRMKHRFETEREAVLFMVYNGEVIESQSGVKPHRSYWCDACAGYHITHTELKNVG